MNVGLKNKPLTPEDIGGFHYLRGIQELLLPLRDADAHGNRELFMDQYASLLLLYFFNPVLTSLRSLQQATGLQNVQEMLGIRAMSLGALSHNGRYVFDPALLEPVVQQVAQRAQRAAQSASHPTLDQTPLTLIAADGTFLKALPSMSWALFRTQSAKRGAKLHLQLDVRTGVPLHGELTTAMASEKKALAKALRSQAIYLLDRGYNDYSLFQKIHDAGSQFVCRLNTTASYAVQAQRPLSNADQAAGVLCDQEVIVGSEFTAGDLSVTVRRLVIERTDGERILILTNTDLPAQVVADLYRWRWQVELFFRWFKCILGCTHWISRSRQGLTLQVYVALIASMLITLWTGRKPTKRTFEMMCLYFMGWARAEELAAHIQALKRS